LGQRGALLADGGPPSGGWADVGAIVESSVTVEAPVFALLAVLTRDALDVGE
jgi:hypothetical protein